MGVFRSKGVEDQAAVEASGEPETPGQHAVTQIVTGGSFGVTWQLPGEGAAVVAPTPEPESAPDAEPEIARHARPDDELSVSFQQWLRDRTHSPAVADDADD